MVVFVSIRCHSSAELAMHAPKTRCFAVSSLTLAGLAAIFHQHLIPHDHCPSLRVMHNSYRFCTDILFPVVRVHPTLHHLSLPPRSRLEAGSAQLLRMNRSIRVSPRRAVSSCDCCSGVWQKADAECSIDIDSRLQPLASSCLVLSDDTADGV